MQNSFLIKNKNLDIVIINGTLIDGTGKERYKTDIRITDGKIADINKNIGPADIIINAKDLIVAPGVIDIHGHSNATVYMNPSFESKIFQGITTEVWGNCGQSFAPILRGENRETVIEILSASLGAENLNMEWSSFREYLKHLPKLGINVLPLIGHAIIRTNILGRSNRKPTKKEMKSMIKLLEECLEMGAYGMSTGLEYSPGSFSTKDELIQLCKVLVKYNAFYSTHIRNEDKNLWTSIDEALEVCERSGCPVHIAHLKLAGMNNWGQSKRLLNYLSDAHKKGLAVTWDVYPYTAWGGGFEDLFPAFEKVHDKLAKMSPNSELKKKLKREITQEMKLRGSSWDKITITHALKSHGVSGKNIREIAVENNEDVLDTFFRILLENNGNVKIIGHDMTHEDMKLLLKHPDTIIATDSRAITYDSISEQRHPHPRYCGSIPKILRFARESLFSFEEAIRKMTSLPADRMKLWNRGRIEKGKNADLMIFDPNTVNDNATYENPVQPPTGIDYVIVNGYLVIYEGVHTGNLKGKLLKRKC
jgi:N-acyl-D-amino-acid deacylase